MPDALRLKGAFRMNTLGFIGMGNMAGALAEGFIRSGRLPASRIYAYAPHQEKLAASAARIGFTACASLKELTAAADTIVMACKPYQVEDVLKACREDLRGKALLSVALGWNFARYTALLDPSTRIQCIMPNTPALVREGVLLFEEAHSLAADERAEIMELFGALGMTVELPSALMGIGGAVAGCGPAFADLMMEAYADAGVKYGLPRETALRLAEQTLLGSARLALQSGEHPGVLKDRVTSPGGTTIRGVCALEKAAFRSACIESIDAVMSHDLKRRDDSR